MAQKEAAEDAGSETTRDQQLATRLGCDLPLRLMVQDLAGQIQDVETATFSMEIARLKKILLGRMDPAKRADLKLLLAGTELNDTQDLESVADQLVKEQFRLEVVSVPRTLLSRASYKRVYKEHGETLQCMHEFVPHVDWEEGHVLMVVHISGTPETPYEGGVFRVEIFFPPEYPFTPPDVRLLTKMWAPTVSADGRIKLPSTMLETWSPATTILKIISEIREQMRGTFPCGSDWSDAANSEAARQLKARPADFAEQARDWTERYAKCA
mmetsp:Transcript_14638/g.27483  ORF Transcript_14638/g.27483 Transcript_14638/m.27483 type:complete len:269 (+) Transcript_14638:78-884(+)